MNSITMLAFFVRATVRKSRPMLKPLANKAMLTW